MTPELAVFIILMCEPFVCKKDTVTIEDNVCSVVVTRYEPYKPHPFKDRLIISQTPCFEKDSI